jgi:hypothetical protein
MNTAVPPTVAPSPAQPIAHVTSGVNVRSGPGTDFAPPIGSLAADQEAEIVAVNPTGNWYKVKYGNGEGWIFGATVVVIGDIANLPRDPGPPTPNVTVTRVQPSATPPPPTSTAVSIAAVPPVGTLPVTTTPATIPPTTGTQIPVEALVGGAGLLAVLGYVGLYLRGVASVDRYTGGFVVERCPVCRRGELTTETRQDRVLGIPRARRTVRCSVCRSVLRETGPRRWRYAVDRIENPTMYERFNGREIDDNTLQSLMNQPIMPGEPRPRPPVTPPTFVDDDDAQ